MSRIQETLSALFNKHRLIFWYDPEVNLGSEYNEVTLTDVTKVTVENNEFALKYRMMREQPKDKFLLYLPYPRPDTHDNWLLDLELAGKVFNADAKSLALQDLGLQEDDRQFIEKYPHFFRLKSNRERLSALLSPEDQPSERTLKMLSVLCKSEPTVDSILLSLIADRSTDARKVQKEILDSGLEDELWKHAQRYFGFKETHCKLTDLLVEVFQTATPLAEGKQRHQQSYVFLSRWKDSSRYREFFEEVSNEIAQILDVKNHLGQSFEALGDLDSYSMIDQRVIVLLREQIISRSISIEQITEVISLRKRSFWHTRFHHIYKCLHEGAKLLHRLDNYDFDFTDVDQSYQSYTHKWYKLDGNHRRMLYHLRKANQHTLLDSFSNTTEGRYLNEFVHPVNQKLSKALVNKSQWKSALTAQRDFFSTHVQPYIDKGRKVFVLISDALRYEIAVELMERVHREDKFQASITPALSSLPSYTQLGMASLLPNTELSVSSKDATVKVDGKSASGIDAREKILNDGTSVNACAVKLENFLAMNSKAEGRDLTRNHDVIYLYHNGIDAVGDKRETEDKLPEAAEEEIGRILAAMKKVSAVNGSNLLVTADHGFLYQSSTPDESQFTEVDKSHYSCINRRFAISDTANSSNAMDVYSADELGITGDQYFHIPKGTQMLKVQGSGTRFVHGGASLQETVIPVLHVTKSRDSDVEPTHVDIIRTGSNKITTTEVSIKAFQLDPVGEKTLPRTLKVGFYGADGIQISEQVQLVFNSSETDPRLREQKVSIMLSPKADAYLNQDILLKLSEPVDGSSHSIPYKDYPFRYEKHFTSDFEDF